MKSVHIPIVPMMKRLLIPYAANLIIFAPKGSGVNLGSQG